MAFDISSVRGQAASTRIKEFIVDSVSDIANLPTQTKKGVSGDGQPFEEDYCDSGSTALVSTGEVYCLFPSGKWAEI